MKRSLIPATLLVLLAATACGEQQAGSGSPETPAGEGSPTVTIPVEPTKPSPTIAPPTEPIEPSGPVITTGPSGVKVPPGFDVVPPEQVDGKSLPEDLYKDHKVWVSDDGRTLQLFAMAPDPCTVMEATIQAADKSQVKIALSPMAQPQGGPEGQICATVVTPVPVSVGLAEVLGNRQIVLTAGG